MPEQARCARPGGPAVSILTAGLRVPALALECGLFWSNLGAMGLESLARVGELGIFRSPPAPGSEPPSRWMVRSRAEPMRGSPPRARRRVCAHAPGTLLCRIAPDGCGAIGVSLSHGDGVSPCQESCLCQRRGNRSPWGRSPCCSLCRAMLWNRSAGDARLQSCQRSLRTIHLHDSIRQGRRIVCL